MSAITNITKDTWQEEIVDKSGLTIIDFWADWCGPCKMMNPILEKLAQELQNSETIKVDGVPVRIAKVDIMEETELATSNQITSIPNLLFFHKGVKIHETVGTMPYGVLKETIENIARSLV